MNNSIKAGLYCRVSTDIQMEGYSIDAQKEMLAHYCASKEITDYKYYIDGGWSGSNIKRPKIQELIEDIQDKKINMVIVFKLDRLSRSQKDTLFLIEEVFNPNDCGFISIKENFDTTTPFGKAMIGILSVFAQLERETILERTRIGRRKRAEEGLWYGNQATPFAYDYDKNTGTLVPIPEKVKIVKKIIELVLHGTPVSQVAEIMHMNEGTVRNILTTKANIGKVPYKDEVFEGKHEAIISERTYEKVQDKLKERAVDYKHANYLLSGKIVCGKCGAKYRYQKYTKSSVRLFCYSQQKTKKYLIKDPNCKNRKYYDYEIEDAVIKDLMNISLDDSEFAKKMEVIDVSDSTLKKERLEQIDKQINNLVNFIATDVSGIGLEITKNKIEQLQEERKKIENEIREDRRLERKAENLKDKLEGISEAWATMTFNEKRNLIVTVIDKVVVDDYNIQIHYKL